MPKNYQATMAAIRSAYGHRLRAADYRDLMNMHSVAEIVAFLKETEGYGELLQGLEPNYTHRGYLEMLLNRNLFTQCLHFCSLEHLQHTPFFRFFIYDYEIRELIKKIQLIPSGPEAYISAMDAWLDPYLSFSQEKLARAETPAEIIEAVAQTPYAAVLRKFSSKGDIVRDYSACEIGLRACCMERILKEAEETVKGDDLPDQPHQRLSLKAHFLRGGGHAPGDDAPDRRPPAEAGHGAALCRPRSRRIH